MTTLLELCQEILFRIKEAEYDISSAPINAKIRKAKKILISTLEQYPELLPLEEKIIDLNSLDPARRSSTPMEITFSTKYDDCCNCPDDDEKKIIDFHFNILSLQEVLSNESYYGIPLAEVNWNIFSVYNECYALRFLYDMEKIKINKTNGQLKLVGRFKNFNWNGEDNFDKIIIMDHKYLNNIMAIASYEMGKLLLKREYLPELKMIADESINTLLKFRLR